MKKVRIGVLGGYRGTAMINYCKRSENAEIVAICDKSAEVIEVQKENCKDCDITFYMDFDEFLNHDMDAVVLANYATEHAPFAIKAMKKGFHVYSEVLPVQTMKEAVELVEAVEQTGKIYAYGENYCFMPAPYEMKKLYKAGKIGELEYAECEYIHNCEPIWPSITYGDENHWRNNKYSTYYCTHSIGPVIHATGLRPVSVTGFESTMNERAVRNGAKGASFGVEMITLENGAIVKSIHGCFLYKNSIWYSMYGSKGNMESSREITGENTEKIYIDTDEYSGAYGTEKKESYNPTHELQEYTEGVGHGGSDIYTMHYFVERILGHESSEMIDVYEALDMFLPGMFAYRSILNGGIPMEIPNLRNKEERDKWRNDTACVTPSVAGDMLLPTRKGGTPEIEEGVYSHVKDLWRKEIEKKESNYRKSALNQGSKPKEKK